MPFATTTVNVFPVDREQAEAAAQQLRDLIGNRPDPWVVSIFTPENLAGAPWIVEVSGMWRGQPLLWRLLFAGPDQQTAAAVIGQFRLNLQPYPAN